MVEYHTFYVSYEDDSSHNELTFSYLNDARNFFNFLIAKASLLNLVNFSIREEVEFNND